MKVAAPGKLFLTGAYAVLEGAPAIVVAVDRFVIADTERRPNGPIRPEIEAVARMLEAPAPYVDASDLESDGRKLGLGSSAAGAIAAAGAILAARGTELVGDAVVHAREVAMRAHRESQPRGSGGDLAASAHGGTVRVRRLDRDDPSLAVAATQLPRGLVLRAFSTARPVRTSDALDRVAARRSTSPDVERALAILCEAAHEGASACDVDDASAFLAACARHVTGLAALGDAVGLALFPEEARRMNDVSGSVVLLPSGAGGGDVVLWVGTRPPSDHETHALGACGLSHFALEFGARGIHRVDSQRNPTGN